MAKNADVPNAQKLLVFFKINSTENVKMQKSGSKWDRKRQDKIQYWTYNKALSTKLTTVKKVRLRKAKANYLSTSVCRHVKIKRTFSRANHEGTAKWIKHFGTEIDQNAFGTVPSDCFLNVLSLDQNRLGARSWPKWQPIKEPSIIQR